jgi:hypothetical protein
MRLSVVAVDIRSLGLGAKVTLVPGLPAIVLARRGLVAAGVAFAATFLVVIPLNNAYNVPELAWLHQYFGAALLLEFGLVGTAVLLQLLFLKRDKQEAAAGYTTSLGQHRELPQVDHGSGVVIRTAGQPLFRRGQAKEARARARATSTDVK